MKNLYFVTVYSKTTDGSDEYRDEYSGTRYDTYEAAKAECDEARRHFPEAYISSEEVDD